jgi:tRNA(Met) cytidine acetyltransferase
LTDHKPSLPRSELSQWLAERGSVDCHRQVLFISGSRAWAFQQCYTVVTYFCETNAEFSASNDCAKNIKSKNAGPKNTGRKSQEALLLSNRQDAHAKEIRSENGYSPDEQTKEKGLVELCGLVTQVEIKHYKQHLGRDYPLIIYNAFDGIKPNALLAIEGNVKRNGLLLVLCPPLSTWAEYEASNCGINFSYLENHRMSYFIARLLKKSQSDPNAAFYCETRETSSSIPLPASLIETSKVGTSISSSLPLALVECPSLSGFATKQPLEKESKQHIKPKEDQVFGAGLAEQQRVRENIISLITEAKAEKSRILIKAKRGRGKSTLLGLCALDIAEWIFTNNEQRHRDNQDSKIVVYITAPSRRNCEKALSAFNDHTSKPDNHSELVFIPPDQLGKLNKDSFVLVDEAASLAPDIVMNACKRFSKIILATTNVGYEGSGLGFSLKVLPKLRKDPIAFREFELTAPLRWHLDDPLEKLFETIFVPHCEGPLIGSPRPTSLKFMALNASTLSANEELVVSVFNLLLQSHYQTTPDDFMRLLDSSNQRYFIATDKTSNTLVAVASVTVEGRIPEGDMTDLELSSGLRRVNGHLVAQNLSTTFAEPFFMRETSWRIGRIVVQEKMRNQHIGRKLLTFIEDTARATTMNDKTTHKADNEFSSISVVETEQAPVQLLTTSFGFANTLCSFWTKSGYDFIKAGNRIDTSSGQRSIVMAKGLTTSSASKLTQLLALKAYYLRFLLDQPELGDASSYLAAVEAELSSALEATTIERKDANLEYAIEKILCSLNAFTEGQRPYSMVHEAIYAFIHEPVVANKLKADANMGDKTNESTTQSTNQIAKLQRLAVEANALHLSSVEKTKKQRMLKALLQETLQKMQGSNQS